MIAKMDRVEIICLREKLTEIVPFLHRRGLLDLEEVPLDVEQVPDFLARADVDEADREEASRLEELDQMLRELVPLLAVKPSEKAVLDVLPGMSEIPQADYPNLVRTWHREIRSMARRRTNARDNLEVLNNYRQLLQTLTPVLGSRKVNFGQNARAIVLKGEAQRAVEQLNARLSAVVGPDAEFIRQDISRSHVVGVLLYPEAKNEAVTRVLREEGITPVDTPEKAEGENSLQDVLRRVEARIREQENSLSDIETQLKAYTAEHGPKLVAMHRIVQDDLSEFRAVKNFANSNMVAVIHGWCPSDDVPALQSALQKEFEGQVVLNQLPMKDVPRTKVPTLLKNPEWLKPFERLLGFLKPPTYGSYDATLLVTVSFIVFYGFILGDAGYGAIIIGIAYAIRKKWGYNQLLKDITTIVMAMGASSIVFGLIYMEIFGDAVYRIVHFSLFHRGVETNILLLLGILFGVIHIPLALILGIREDFRHDHKEHAYEKLGMLLGLLAVMIGVTIYYEVPLIGHPLMAYTAGIIGLLGAGLLFYSMGAMGLVGLLEIVSLGGNVLSYARLMALGIASIALADIANEAARESVWYIGVPIAVMVHTLNIVIGVFSPTVHSLRLNYVEFLPKFFDAEGRPYKPFKKEATW